MPIKSLSVSGAALKLRHMLASPPAFYRQISQPHCGHTSLYLAHPRDSQRAEIPISHQPSLSDGADK